MMMDRNEERKETFYRAKRIHFLGRIVHVCTPVSYTHLTLPTIYSV